MLHIAKILHAKFWLLVAWAIILIAILFTLMRQFLPQVDLANYRHEIERILEARAGMPLRIGAMNAEMQDAHLALKFSDITVVDPETDSPRVHFREAYVRIHLLRSLLNGELTLGSGTVVGGWFNLVRHPDGAISVNGFRETGGQGSLAAAFLRRTHLRVSDSEIYWQDLLTGAAPLHFTQVNANLINSEVRHQLVAIARLGAEATEQLRLVVDLQEGTDDPLAANGRVYLKSEGLELADRLVEHLPGGIQVDKGRVDIELWGEVQGGRFQRFRGVTEVNDLVLTAEEALPLELDRFASLFDWRRSQNGWQLDLDRLLLVCNRQLWPPGRLSMAWQASETGATALQIGTDYLGLKEVTRFAALLDPVGEDFRQALVGLAPAGHLTRFRLALNQQQSQTARWQVSGSVTQYSHRSWRSVPGLSGLGLNFAGNQDGGSLLLGSRRFMADMPRLFRDKLTANQLKGNFNWRLLPQTGLSLKTDDLYMSTDHVQTLNRMDLQIPLDGENPFIDMQTDFWEGDGAYKSRYLPVGIMPKPLVDWLDRSLVSGHIANGSMLLYGPLKAFPFNNHEGRFEVIFSIKNMVLDYMPGWPRLENMVADAHFLNNSLEIELFKGNILGSRLRHTKARIRKLKGSSPVEISGSVVGPFSDIFRLLDETPLRRQFAKFTAAVEGSGQTRTWLDLQIPLKQQDVWQILGKIDFQLAVLQIKDHDLAVESLVGRLHFDDQQVWGSDIEGRLLEQPVALQVDPQLQDEERTTHITTVLTAQSEWLQQRFPGVLDPLQGAAESRVQLAIAHGDSQTPVSLSVHSGLQGMAVKLPEPLGKKREQERNLELTIDFLDKQKHELQLAYGGLVHASLRDKGEGFRQGEIRFGASLSEFPDSAVFRLRGETKKLDLDRWAGWLHSRPQETDSGQSVPLHIDLQVGELKFIGVNCPNVGFQLEPVTNGWQARFTSDDLDGIFTLPDNPEKFPLVGHLKHLRLKFADLVPAEGQKDAPTESREIDPRSLPELNLLVESLWIDEKRFGKALLQWDKSPLGIQVTKLAIVGDELDLSGEGHWHKMGDKHLTKLELEGHVESLGQLQKDLGLQIGVDRAPMDFQGVLNWPLAPYELDLERLSGKLDLKVGAGEVTEVDPGMGRLVGLLSLHALGKRLSLDFSDLFAKGLEFDQIEGNFSFEDGNASTNNLVMTSPSAQVLVSGRTGLAAKDYDQTVTVIPRVSSTLPLVGAIAINPTVGVVLALGQQLFGNQVDRIAQTQYQLSGTWEEPAIMKVVRQRAQDDKFGMMPDLPADQ